MSWLLSLLRAIPVLCKLLGLAHDQGKKSHASKRRKEKYDLIDARIAAARRGVRDSEEEQP